MGNSIGKFDIVLDHAEQGISSRDQVRAVRSGLPVRGRVCIRVKQPIRNVRGLFLQMHGKEKIAIRTSKDTIFRADRRFAVSSTKISDLAGQTLYSGYYQYPFSFTLPESLPSSMYFKQSRDFCQIKYKFTASLEGKRVSAKRDFIVASARLPNSRVPCFLEPVTHNIKTLGTLNNGNVTFGVSVNDTHVGRGQTIALAIASRNDSNVDIKALKVELVEKIKIGLSAGHATKSKKILLKNIMTGLKGKSRSELRGNRTDGVNANQMRYEEIYHELVSGTNTWLLKIPKVSLDSYAGHYFTVAHYLEITHETKSITDSPRVRIPLKIGYPHEEQREGGAMNEDTHESLQDIPYAAAMSIPIDEAASLSMEPISTHYIEIPPENVILGGGATVFANERKNFDWGNIVPVPVPTTVVPTLANLLEEMLSSVNDFDIISQKLDNPLWGPVFSSLTVDEYGMIIAHVNIDFDQPKVAGCIALYIRGRADYTSKYIVSALRNTAQWNRPAMLKVLMPWCTDVSTGRNEIIMAELTAWETTVSSHCLRHTGTL